jgi:hypothetical protein
MFPRYFSGEITNWPRLPCYSLHNFGLSYHPRTGKPGSSGDGFLFPSPYRRVSQGGHRLVSQVAPLLLDHPLAVIERIIYGNRTPGPTASIACHQLTGFLPGHSSGMPPQAPAGNCHEALLHQAGSQRPGTGPLPCLPHQGRHRPEVNWHRLPASRAGRPWALASHFRVRSPQFRVRSPQFRVRSPQFRVRSPQFRVRSPQFRVRFFCWNFSQVSDNKLFVKPRRSPNLLNSVFNKNNTNNKRGGAFLKV